MDLPVHLTRLMLCTPSNTLASVPSHQEQRIFAFFALIDVEVRSARYCRLPAIVSLRCSEAFAALEKGARFLNILWASLYGVTSEYAPSSRDDSVRLSVRNELHIKFDQLIQTVIWLPWSHVEDMPSLCET